MKKAYMKIVLPKLESFQRSANQELRLDAFDDDIKNAINDMRLVVTEELSDETIIEIARKKGIEINAKNLAILKSQYKQVTGVNLFASEPNIAIKLKAFTGDNVRLIKRLQEDTYEQLEGIIFRGVSRGQSLKDVSTEINKRFDISKKRAKLIARDQTASLNGEVTKIRQQSAGVTKYKWVTSLDERVRDSHQQLNGQIFSWNDPPSEGHPGEPINCRCIAVPVFNSLAE